MARLRTWMILDSKVEKSMKEILCQMLLEASEIDKSVSSFLIIIIICCKLLGNQNLKGP